MFTFAQADAAVKASKKGFVKLPGVETELRCHYPDTYAIWFHNTAVVLIHADGTYTLQTGGWRTNTTKSRLNEYSPVRVYSFKWDWYVRLADGTEVKFCEGMVV